MQLHHPPPLVCGPYLVKEAVLPHLEDDGVGGVPAD